MTSPRVSVLLPVFDAEDTLDSCLRSVERQAFRDWECVLVDDGSRDASLAMARRAAAVDPRIRVVAGPHRGIVAALNVGLAACRAPLVARMDADDVMHRLRLALQVEALERHADWAAAGCHVRLFPRDDLTAGMRSYERWLNGLDTPARILSDAYVECPIAHPTLMARTAVLREFGYRETEGPEDYDLVLRVLAGGLEIGSVPRRLLLWRDAPGRLSRNSPRYAIDAFTACKAEHLARGLLAGGSRYVLWGYGATGRALAAALERHDKHPDAIVEVHPGRLGNRIRNAPVIAPRALAEYRGLPLVVSVAGAGPRQQIRNALASMGYRETHDFIAAA
ncbi:MAG: glycosyltransferase [Deltaproteobacteria bacterium]|nr:glycosyltransferase [Deltaproteobacteria bacterium]MBW2362574.1 glycosyltransferase [Deltaproteobacteria bacterium]